ncbi:hypothetical protein H3H36_18900 [Duganella sp. FT3S]|uniref:Uncharacterized protein n=1 Tax=Rugamonas fusca TaxID=2758568 RepID=A0A7W2I8F7_9BURK|nr:hypothetical protein [Rugamonas fusca]MBA5607430.1 hypothetical protein [Rugamonas fusca]
MSASSHFYCISHAPCPWPLPEFMTVIGTGDYRPANGIAMAERFPHLAHQNRHLGEYVALYAIRQMLLESNAEGFVGLCHYRRFALSKPIGELRGFNFHAHPDLLATVLPEHYYHDGATPIIPAMVHFQGNIMQQYGANAIVRDLLKFFGDAVDCGVITDAESTAFLSQNAFITAPTVSYIPIPWFVDIVHALEKVMSRFYRNHYIEREGYLERSMAFSCERLQALLLAKKVNAWGWDKVISQPLTLLIPPAQP